MKTINIIKSLVAVIIVMTTLPGFAISDPNNPNSKEQKMKRIVSAAVDFPASMEENSNQKNIVSVNFNVAEDGHVIINEINGSPSFSLYVKGKLEKLILKKMPDLVGKSFIYRFIFSK